MSVKKYTQDPIKVDVVEAIYKEPKTSLIITTNLIKNVELKNPKL